MNPGILDINCNYYLIFYNYDDRLCNFFNTFVDKWWFHFGESARSLRQLAIRSSHIRSPPMTGSTTGSPSLSSAINKKNSLTQKRPNDLVYVRYNLRLRLKCIEQVGLKYNDLLHNDFVQDEEDPVIGWLERQ